MQTRSELETYSKEDLIQLILDEQYEENVDEVRSLVRYLKKEISFSQYLKECPYPCLPTPQEFELCQYKHINKKYRCILCTKMVIDKLKVSEFI